jgi:hypothetical protein
VQHPHALPPPPANKRPPLLEDDDDMRELIEGLETLSVHLGLGRLPPPPPPPPPPEQEQPMAGAEISEHSDLRRSEYSDFVSSVEERPDRADEGGLQDVTNVMGRAAGGGQRDWVPNPTLKHGLDPLVVEGGRVPNPSVSKDRHGLAPLVVEGGEASEGDVSPMTPVARRQFSPRLMSRAQKIVRGRRSGGENVAPNRGRPSG